MFDNPVQQRLLKADVVPRFFALDPFVAKDLFPLGEELLIEQGFLDQVSVIVGLDAHGRKELRVFQEQRQCITPKLSFSILRQC
ncbi:MAG: hypothetical protein JWL59_2944 [Chthoniobacteraceae bacterium]|nr:hypothetical protein [Chthoniobacteraceae bacterium]